MVDRDVVYAKISIVQRCLRRIKDVTALEPKSLDNIDKLDIFTLNLQRAVQATIDLAARIVATEGLGIPQDLKETFKLLSNKSIVSSELAGRMEKMVGFRNIAVHEYQSIDVTVLKSILTKHLKDLEDFYGEVLKKFKV